MASRGSKPLLMPKYLHLEIPEPCHEDWNKMNPEAQGRFCSSCQKTVTDFTNMSDAQLIAFFKNPKPSVCGRFNQEQLERDILIPRKRIPWVKYFFQFTLPAFLLSLKSSAQMGKISVTAPVQKIAVQKLSTLLGDTTIAEKANTVSSVNALPGIAGGIVSSLEETRNIKGTVTDYDGIPLIGASVLIKGTNSGTVTDTSGNFVLINVHPKSEIMVSFIGYESREVTIPNTDKPLKIQLDPYSTRGLVVVIVGSPVKKKTKSKKQEICTKPAEPILSLYPNPLLSSTPLHFKWQNFEAGNYRIEIYNTAGALMKSQKLVLDKGVQETSVIINELLAGNYFARMTNERTGNQLSEQFIILK
jgi:hypothetical protein